MWSETKLLNTVLQDMSRKGCDPICKTLKRAMETLEIRNVYELDYMTDAEFNYGQYW